VTTLARVLIVLAVVVVLLLVLGAPTGFESTGLVVFGAGEHSFEIVVPQKEDLGIRLEDLVESSPSDLLLEPARSRLRRSKTAA
jgi:hypothetical protein